MLKDNKVIKYTVIVSSFIAIIEFIIPFMIAKNYLEDLEGFNAVLSAIYNVLALLGIALVGTYVVRKSQKPEIVEAAVALAIYTCIAYLIEYLVQKFFSYSLLLLMLFMPIKIFLAPAQFITYFLNLPAMVSVIGSMILPFIYFGFYKRGR